MQEVAKRTLDLVVALVAVALLLPILISVAILVKLTSPGPVFYRGVRTARYGGEFRIFKFRTMVVNAERLGGTTTGQNDARLTSIGKTLRDFKLDELPQLFNVIFGDMSLVGPRPEVEEYTSQFTQEEQRILSVRPGITDLSSLKFHDLQSHVGGEDPDKVFRERILPQKNALRLQYVDTRSFWGDIAILWQTFWVIATRPLRRAS
ncbi:MAG: sugar transferase [Lacipirellulaceae bacterium]